jgi:hypothetical protein
MTKKAGGRERKKITGTTRTSRKKEKEVHCVRKTCIHYTGASERSKIMIPSHPLMVPTPTTQQITITIHVVCRLLQQLFTRVRREDVVVVRTKIRPW